MTTTVCEFSPTFSSLKANCHAIVNQGFSVFFGEIWFYVIERQKGLSCLLQAVTAMAAFGHDSARCTAH